MRKIFLIVLSLVIVSMFIVGCGTGQAVRAGKVAKQSTKPSLKVPTCPGETIEATCADETKLLCTILNATGTGGYENKPVLCSPGVCTGNAPNAKCSLV